MEVTMCNCEDYNKCSKCGRFAYNSTIGYQDKPTVTGIKCIFGGKKKWIWKNTENGVQYIFQKENKNDRS